METSIKVDTRTGSADRRGAPSVLDDAGVSCADLPFDFATDAHDRYPIVYSLSIMPLSVVRWAVYVQEAQTGASQVPPVYTFIAVSIFGLSGFFNVILLLTTRRTSGLFGELIHSAPSRAPIIFFRNDRETRDHSAKNNRSKASSKIYDEIYVEQEVHTM